MKLITKISLGAALILFLFSQLFSLWNLTKSQKMIIKSVREYEGQNLQGDIEAFFKKRSSQEKVLEESLSKVFLKAVFRECFDMDSALYIDGKSIYNQTPYEFDVNMAWERRASGRSLSDGGMPLYQYEEKVNGHHLLLTACEDRLEGYQLWAFHYKDVTGIYENTQELFWQGFGMALLLILCMMVPLHLIMRRILRPFYELKLAANTIADGNYAQRVPVRSRDEVGSLSDSFNKMADSVETHVEELSRTNTGQQVLLGSLAHELKTPMMAIGGYAESLRRLSMTEEQKKKSLDYIESECRRLSRLSAKMLELTGMYQADGQMEEEEFSAKEFFSVVDAMAYRRISKKNVHLRTLVEPENLTIIGDKDMLMSLLLNLIDNGCKASDEGMDIWLKADEKGIYVKDFGIGIPAEEVERVTEAFYMVDKSRSRKEGGAGLGLAICQQIAQAHQGHLSIESKKGEGTVVALMWD